jgi:signal transduction histidine kinase
LVALLDKKLNSLPLPAPAQPVQYQYVHAMTSDTSHGLWVSVVNRGLLRLDDRRWDLHGSGLRLPEATPTALWTDTAGRQWLGYADGTAALRAGDSIQVFGAEQGLQVGPIMVIRGSPGEILVGGEWGLARFDGRGFRSLSASRLEAFSGISGIIVRANGDIWLNGNRGVLHMSSDALNDAYDHPLTKLRYDLFDVQDGLPGYAQQGEDASAVAAADGRLWFATNHGIAWIDPDHLIGNRVPPNVVIRSVGAGYFSAPVAKSTDGRLWFMSPGGVANRSDVSVDATGQSTLPALTRDLQIEYTALSLVAPEKNRFRYKLEGYDRDWQDVGNRRQAFYTNLPPRNYRFRVIASNNSGVWNETGASLDFSIAPAYYQTAWFRTLVVVMFLSLLWAAHRLRLLVVERHQAEITALNERLMKAQEQERTRIAGELHDGFTQQISALSLLLGTGKRQPEADAKKTMAEVQRKLIEVGTEVRQLSHNLHPPMLKDAGLPEALRGYCEEFSRLRNIPVSCHADDSVQDLSQGAALAVYRIAQEAMGNAVTHGAAQHVDVRLARSNGLVTLTVTDGGKGFDANRIGGLHGLGLINMRERARQLNGTFELHSEPGRGTTVRVTIPFRRAV